MSENKKIKIIKAPAEQTKGTDYTMEGDLTGAGNESADKNWRDWAFNYFWGAILFGDEPTIEK